MKYSLVLLLSIFSFAYANSPFQEFQSDYDHDAEIDKSWNEHYEKANTSSISSQSVPTSGILADEILTAKRKPLDPELAELVINMSSEDPRKLALIIQECAQDPSEKCPPRVLLVGAPGIGKTTYIQAVSEKAHIPLTIINAPFVSDKYKDSGPENLKAIFKSLLQTKRKIIIAIDELHCLTDGHKNSNDPNPNTAAALWKLVDQCRENPNIILIGIMNYASNMPEQLKSRFEKYICIMKSSDEITQIQQILHHYLKKYKHDCDKKCQQFIARLLKTGEARSIEGTVEMAYWDAYFQEDRKITQKNLETIIKKSNENKKALEIKKENLPARELNSWEKAAYGGALAGGAGACIGGIAGGINHLDQVAQRHGGWEKFWEHDIKPKLGFLHFIIKVLNK